MSEFAHDSGVNPNGDGLSASAVVASRLFSDASMQISDYDSRSYQMAAEFRDIEDPLLHEGLVALQHGIESQDRSRGHFTDGFIVGYKFHALEAELTEDPLTNITEDVLEDFFVTVDVRWGRRIDDHYFDERILALKDEDEDYLDVLERAIPDDEGWSLEERDSFLLGGVVIHDILLLQKRIVDEGELVETVSEDFPLTEDELAQFAQRKLLASKEMRRMLAEKLIAEYVQDANDTSFPENS